MKWKIEGSDHSGDDVIVMVDADDVESAMRQASFAGVKVKTIHPDENSQPAVRLPPAHSVTAPSLPTPPPGYTGKVIIEREEDSDRHHASSTTTTTGMGQRLHLPHNAGTIATIASHIVALTLFVIGVVVFLHGSIQYGRVEVPSPAIVDPTAPAAELNAAQSATSLLQMVAWQQAVAYIGQMLVGLLIVLIAILIEGFITRMVSSIRDTWHKK